MFFPEPAQEQRGPRYVYAGPSQGSYLGIGVAEITSERAKALNLSEERGVEITRVAENSPAEQGGLKTGDVVVEYNGDRVEGLEQFMRMVRETPPGREVKLAVSRSGSIQQVIVKTGTRKTGDLRSETFEIPRFEMPEFRMPDLPRANMSWRSLALGIEAESLDGQLAEFFGVKDGVLIRSVIKGSAADKAGVRAGDVITKVNDTAVANPRDITAAIRSDSSKKLMSLTLIREKREMSVTVTLDEPVEQSQKPVKKLSVR
jgi:serine protease Do